MVCPGSLEAVNGRARTPYVDTISGIYINENNSETIVEIGGLVRVDPNALAGMSRDLRHNAYKCFVRRQ